MDPTEQLSSCRTEIAAIDRSLLELLRRRMDIADEVGRIKAASGAPIVVRDVEDVVLERARQHADACGISPDILDEIFRAVIRGSVERQHRVGVELRGGRRGRVLIIGGAGSMGAWLRRFHELAGDRVDLVDPAFSRLPPQPGCFVAVKDVEDLTPYSAILVSVPLIQTAEVVDALASRQPPGLVVEISSIKHPLLPALERARERGTRVIALHPMFGPSKSHYEPLTFVLAAQRPIEVERAEIEPLLAHPYSRIVAVPFAHHDRLMGWLLGLSHLTSMLFGAALTRSGVAPEELADCASTTFVRQAATARSVLSNDADLYLEIQHLNPYREEVYRAAHEALDELDALVRDADRARFREFIASARETLLEP
jgi:chorismate mutase/prephenate dehydrogenase